MSFTLWASDRAAAYPLIRVRLSIQFGVGSGRQAPQRLLEGREGVGKRKGGWVTKTEVRRFIFFLAECAKEFLGGVLRRKKMRRCIKRLVFLWNKGGAEKENGSVRNKKGGSRQNI